MSSLRIQCPEVGDNTILELDDNYESGQEVFLTLQDWSQVNLGLEDDPFIEGIELDRQSAKDIVDYLTAFYNLGDHNDIQRDFGGLL
jgi:hypothetical protein